MFRSLVRCLLILSSVSGVLLCSVILLVVAGADVFHVSAVLLICDWFWRNIRPPVTRTRYDLVCHNVQPLVLAPMSHLCECGRFLLKSVGTAALDLSVALPACL